MQSYPTEFPMEAVQIIVSNWRSGRIVSEKAKVTEAAWNVLGYGLKMSIGQPVLMGATSAGQDTEKVLGELQLASTTKDSGRSIPPQVLLHWAIEFIKKVLMES
jgi:hypothetical protein